MRKQKASMPSPRTFVPGRQYRGLRGKVVNWVEHKFEEGLLYIHVRFADKTELCWRIATRMTFEEGDLSDWKRTGQEHLTHRNIARANDCLQDEPDRQVTLDADPPRRKGGKYQNW